MSSDNTTPARIDTATTPKRRKLDTVTSPLVAAGYSLAPAETVKAMVAVANGDLGPALGLNIGVQLQVLWNVEADGEDDKELWWDCEIHEKCPDRHSFDVPEANESISVPKYVLKYKPQLDFEASLNQVCFTDEHELYDIEFDGMLSWRHKGSSWVPKPADIQEEERQRVSEGVLSEEERTKPANPILAAFDKLKDDDLQSLKRVLGLTENTSPVVVSKSPGEGNHREAAVKVVDGILANIITTHAKRMQSLPATIQYNIADKIRDVRERLIHEITKHLEENGVLDEVSTKGIIESIVEDFKVAVAP